MTIFSLIWRDACNTHWTFRMLLFIGIRCCCIIGWNIFVRVETIQLESLVNIATLFLKKGSLWMNLMEIVECPGFVRFTHNSRKSYINAVLYRFSHYVTQKRWAVKRMSSKFFSSTERRVLIAVRKKLRWSSPMNIETRNTVAITLAGEQSLAYLHSDILRDKIPNRSNTVAMLQTRSRDPLFRTFIHILQYFCKIL